MKKLLSLMLACVILPCFVLVACSDGESGKPSETPVALKLYEKLEAYYTGKRLTGYREAVALSRTGFDMSKCDTSVFASADGTDTAEGLAERMMALKYLKSVGCEFDEPQDALIRLQTHISGASSLTTTALSKVIIALALYDCEFDKNAAVSELRTRQNTINGGFYERAQSGGESTALNPSTTALALTAYMSVREEVATTVYEDTLHDHAILFIGNAINEDNTISDADGKPSVSVTSECLAALIGAEIPLDGEMSTALLTAIDYFARYYEGMFNSVTGFAGYAEHSADTAGSDVATACAMFAVATAMRGNPFVETPAA